MTDPIISGYLAEVAGALTMGVLNALTRSARQQFESSPQQQALARCYQAGTAALLPEDDPAGEMLRPILQTFFERVEAQKELSVLARGRELDQEVLVELFEEESEGQDLPDFDFATRLADFVEAFLRTAAQEEALVEVIKIDQLRQANDSLLRLVTNVEAIRQAVEQSQAGSGDVEGRDIYAENIVTGVQHIVNLYQAGGGVWRKPDYEAALKRYFDWLCDAMGKVTLRGILKRPGQPPPELPLVDIYVPLAAEALPETRELWKQRLSDASVTPSLTDGSIPAEKITMQALLTKGDRLAVIGGPGCGKTTVLYHIAWTLAEALRTDNPALATEQLGLTGELPLPVYVPLNRYANHRRRCVDDPDPQQRQLATFVSQYLIERQAGLKLPSDFFATLLTEGRHIILLLDGLDEVPDEAERIQVSRAVSDLTYGRPHLRVVVTSRSRAYQGKAILENNFRLVRVLPLAPEQVTDLIRQAYQALYPTESLRDDRERLAADLVDGVTKLEADRAARLGDSSENRLVTTPLMVRMLLIVHVNRRRLPDQRAELYAEVVDTLLTSAHHPDEAVAQELEQMGGDWRNRREMLQYLAFQMHSRGQDAGRDLDEQELKQWLQHYLVDQRFKSPEDAETLVNDFVRVSRERASVLEEQAGQHRFSHLSFQEFLTARYLAEVERDVGRIVSFIETENRATDSWWREPILLTVGYLNVNTPAAAARLVHGLACLDDLPAPQTALALAMAELAATAFLEWGGSDATRQGLARCLVDLLTNPDLPDASPPLRAAAGRALARLGDPREGVLPLRQEDGRRAPHLEWCEVPAGRFLMGANEDEAEAYDDEKPQHELTLPTFYVARYPVTNAQYALFIEAGGYDDEQWWTEAGWAWCRGAEPDLEQIPDEDLRKQYADWLAKRPAERRSEPFFWREERFNLANQPVVGVSWYEAMAYCAWLGEQLAASHQSFVIGDRTVSLAEWLAGGDWQVRLPSEAEWEKAAGWDPQAGRKRVYAWGDDWDETKANVAKKVGWPSAVGIFPGGASACGALDMTGNVLEWSLSSWGGFDRNKPGFRYPFTDARPQTGSGERDAVDTAGFRALRGGSWYNDRRFARVSYRSDVLPDNFSGNSGFRLVVAPVLP